MIDIFGAWNQQIKSQTEGDFAPNSSILLKLFSLFSVTRKRYANFLVFPSALKVMMMTRFILPEKFLSALQCNEWVGCSKMFPTLYPIT